MTEKKFPHSVVARINEYIESADRESRYDAPLRLMLAEKGIGKVSGANAQTNEQYRIIHVDLQLEMLDVGPSLALVQEELERCGVPAGSELRFLRNKNPINRPLGKLETVELYLDGASLPAKVYEDFDFQAFYDAISRTLEASNAGAPRGVWSGPVETGIFLFGENAQAIEKGLLSLLPQFPILQNARLVLRSANPKTKPSESRLPKA